MITMSSLASTVLWLAVAGLIFWLLWWLVGYLALPQPFDKVARVVIAIVAVVILINFLLSLMGATPIIKFSQLHLT